MSYIKTYLSIVFLLCFPYGAFSEQQTTYGNNSPIFSKNNGKIIINYNTSNSKIWNKEKAKILINKISNNSLQEIMSYKWFKLSNDEMYLSTSYRTKDKNYSNDIILLNKNMEDARIFHEVVISATLLYETAVGLIDNIPHMFLYNIAGSGGYLSGDLYRKNELGYLEKVSSTSIYEGDGLSYASVAEFNDKIIINSAGTVYSFRKNKNNYEFYKYIPNINYPIFGSNIHILKIKSVNSKIILDFDNKIMRLKKRDNSWVSVTKPKLKIGDQIIVLSNAKVYRLFTVGLDGRKNIFETYILNKKNNTIDRNSGDYYHIHLDLAGGQNFLDHYMIFSLN